MSSSVIWAESPLQLLSAVEAHRAGLCGPCTEARLRAGAPSLETTAAEIERLGVPAGLRMAGSAPRPVRPAEGGVWVIGDAFSGAVQRGLVAPGRCRLVIVDDGLATIHLLELLTASRPKALVRARARPGPARRALGLAAWGRLRAAASAGRLTVCTALPISAELRDAVRGLGAAVHVHDFPWLRGRPAAEAPPQRLVVLGSSLVRNGLVHRDRYLAWVRSLAAAEPLQYRPHRRESPDVLDELRADPRISVVETGVPVEISLRGLTAEHRVVSLPSTALTSLRLMLRSTGTRIEGVPVPPDWWTDAADPGLRDHLSLFLDGLEIAT
ncbi:hypothetical protein [Thermomonospora amylolytica]|uniref:hypothetical protein n=1 Tax=Thermomonospora amylolytica TaxID=1411117 RepID=UPI000E6CA58B|nr:hypothetical protein [Thermomonospora amylolytica]